MGGHGLEPNDERTGAPSSQRLSACRDLRPFVATTVDPISRFAKRIEEWQGVWRSIDLRSICFRQDDGWRNALAHIQLLAGKPVEYKIMDLTYNGEGFAVLHKIADIRRFSEFVSDLRAGRLRIGGRTIRIDCPVPSAQPGEQVSAYNYAFEAVPRRWAGTRDHVAADYFTLVLQGRGRQVAEYVTTEDYEQASRVLFSNRRPYEGFPDVMRSLFSVTYNYELPGMAAMLTVVAPSYARIESVQQIDGSQLAVRVQGPPGSSASAFKLNSIMRRRDGSAARASVELAEMDRVDSPGYARFTKDVKLSGAPLVDLFLIYRDENVDERRLVLPTRDTPNPRIIAHLAFDDDATKLREYLFPETPKASAGFEIAVSWLFHFCGFGVVSYGVQHAKLDAEIDFVAFVPLSRAVMCVECKASELKTDKLVLLANRRDKLKAALPDHDVVTAAVTALDHATEPERREARSLDISILTKIELEEMLAMAERHASAQEVMEYVRRKVPSML